MRAIYLSLLLIFLLPSALQGQDSSSLGDIARRARAEKGKAANTASPTMTPPAASATAHSAEPDSKPPAQAAKPAETEEQALARKMAEARAKADEANLHEMERYQESFRALFNIEDFQKIDELADKARSTKARLTGGFWAIHLLYAPLMQPAHGANDSTESEWQIHLDRLQRWVNQRPQSVTARVALAGAYLNYGWKARGGGYADQVTEQGWQLFGERSEKAGKILAEAFNLPVKDPEWHVVMHQVMQAQGVGKAMQTALFEKAIAFEPDYQYYYRLQAQTLLPKWDGEEGETALFSAQIADRIGGKKGDMMYYQIATIINCSCDARNQPNGMSWPRIKRGYAAVQEQYGTSLVSMNQMAAFAAAAGDADFAEELLTRIGENWDPHAWHNNRKYFDEVREWAGFSRIEKTMQDGMKAAEANLQTPAGRQYDAELSKSFQSGYGDIVAACVKIAGEPTLTPFDLFLQIGKTGTVENLYMSPTTRVSLCLASKVSSGRFPAPPQPSYWVRISMSFRP